MISQIWKYPAPLTDELTIPIPEGAQVLCVQMQGGSPRIWCKVDPAQKAKLRNFKWVGTGHEFDDDSMLYIGTVQIHEGFLIYHLYEEL